jgi:CubicO group peptidase (beta-lactamase class C family)
MYSTLSLEREMRKIPQLLLTLFLLVAGGFHSRLSGASADRDSVQAGSQRKDQSAVNARIARIENDLLPAVVIKGQPLEKMKIGDRMKALKVPGVSVAFFDHGQVVWTRAYGFADLATKKRVTPGTLFQAASISKPGTALAALHLVQEGKLSLDQSVNEKLRTWKVPANKFTAEQKVTLRGILSHSAGLTVHGFPGYAAGEPLPTVVQILNGEKPANSPPVRVDVVPGTIWRYSGGGYVVAQLLLIDVTGTPFPQLLKDLVLRPAGMTHSTYEQPLPKNLWDRAATPYRPNGEAVKGGWHTYPEMAAAGLWTTPSDLAGMAIEVQNEYAGKSSRILSQAMVRQMLTRQKDDWGLGFGLANSGATLRFGHGGANEGFRCDLQAYAAGSGQGIAIMTNSDSGGELMGEYERAVAKEYGWPDFHPVERAVAKVNPSVFPAYAGVYEIASAGRLTVSVKNNIPYIQAEPLGPGPQELFPESSKDFFILSSEVTFTFEKNEKGAVAKLIVRAGPQTLEAKKIH